MANETDIKEIYHTLAKETDIKKLYYMLTHNKIFTQSYELVVSPPSRDSIFIEYVTPCTLDYMFRDADNMKDALNDDQYCFYSSIIILTALPPFSSNITRVTRLRLLINIIYGYLFNLYSQSEKNMLTVHYMIMKYMLDNIFPILEQYDDKNSAMSYKKYILHNYTFLRFNVLKMTPGTFSDYAYLI